MSDLELNFMIIDFLMIIAVIIAIGLTMFVLYGIISSIWEAVFGPKCINEEYKDVEVKIVDKYYCGSYTTPMMVGKVTTMQIHPSQYEITVEYNDVRYTLDDSEIYNKYYNKIGKTAIGILRIRTYDNGKKKCAIVNME